jgi:ribose 5-phosphate isomerase B
MGSLKIYFGADHGGFEVKEKLKVYVAKDLGHEVIDCGNDHFDPDDGYPDFILPVARAVDRDPEARGIIIGGSGQGEAIVANKVVGARAFVFYGPALAVEAVDITGRQSTDPFENVKLSRLHNNTNVISFGKRFVGLDQMKEVLKIWLDTPFEGGRHERRLNKIKKLLESNG